MVDQVLLSYLPATSVESEFGLVQLHWFVASLEVEGSHLWADIPHGHGVVVRRVHPLGLGVDPAQLNLVVPQERLTGLWARNHQQFCFRLGERRHLLKNPGFPSNSPIQLEHHAPAKSKDAEVEKQTFIDPQCCQIRKPPAIDDEVWEFPGDPHGPFSLSILNFPVRSRLCCISNDWCPLEYQTKSSSLFLGNNEWKIMFTWRASSFDSAATSNSARVTGCAILTTYSRRPWPGRVLGLTSTVTPTMS